MVLGKDGGINSDVGLGDFLRPVLPPHAALRGDGLKCSHWSLEVQPVPYLSDHIS